MNGKRVLTAAILPVVFLMLIGCTQPQKKPSGGENQNNMPTVTATKTEQAPELDGVAEEVWQKAKPLKIKLSTEKGTGFNQGKTELNIKALYDKKNLYMQFKWTDPTKSLARGPWIKKKDKLELASYSQFDEDKFALIWDTKASVKGFNQEGCAATCHNTDIKNKSGAKIKKHFTKSEKEVVDLWYWKVTRQNSLFGPDRPGLMHDQFIDNAKYDPKAAGGTGAGRHDDPGGHETKLNANEEKTQPLMVFESKPLNGNPYVIVHGYDKVKKFSPEMIKGMKEGDHLPGIIAYQISADPADIFAKGSYKEGIWTFELKRPLKTRSEMDVQFEDFEKPYFFGAAVFDQSQNGEHAIQKGALRLMFQKN